MFCPRCASNQSDDVKFCTQCGANLHAVRQVVDTRDVEKKFDWSDTWVSEMFLSANAHKRRKEEMERRRGITPEVKRYEEIKAGIITSSVGIALSIFLFVFMQGIILNGNTTVGTAEILSRVWVAGVIPFFVGMALIINGVVVSKKLVEIANRSQMGPRGLEGDATRAALRPADTSGFVPTGVSVTDQTTRHLSGSEQK